MISISPKTLDDFPSHATKSQYFRGVVTWVSQRRIRLIAKAHYKPRLSESWARRLRVTKPRERLSQLRPPKIIFAPPRFAAARSEEHTSELQSLMRISNAVFCLKKN